MHKLRVKTADMQH